MSRYIWVVLNLILALNARVYGTGATVELCRDLTGTWRNQ